MAGIDLLPILLASGALAAGIGLAVVAGKIAARLLYAASQRGKTGEDL